jgi:pilus assembly protein Flp/PilA
LILYLQGQKNLPVVASYNLRGFGITSPPAIGLPVLGHRELMRKHHMKRSLLKFWNDESGATAIEYGLIAAGISLAIIAAVTSVGTNLNTVFSSVSTSLK